MNLVQVLSRDFLHELRIPEGQEELEDFLPEEIFVRSVMRAMFQDLTKEYHKGEVKRILVGPPGIGKSVLFFLAVLGRAWLGESVIYFRKVESEISVFVMEKGDRDGPRSVNVLVCRYLDERQYGNLGLRITKPTKRNSRRSFFVMLDGPHHDDDRKEDLMNGAFRALARRVDILFRRRKTYFLKPYLF